VLGGAGVVQVGGHHLPFRGSPRAEKCFSLEDFIIREKDKVFKVEEKVSECLN
jgi:hypothetical protein